MPRGEVIFTVFAGRRRFLGILLSYVRPLITDNVVDRLDLWDYCRLESDRHYLQSLIGRRIAVLNGTASLNSGSGSPGKSLRARRAWREYYAYYAERLSPADLLIKCDDDIVFIANLPALISFARSDRERRHLLYYPSIINNDVAAAFQAESGLISDPEFAVSLPPPNATRSHLPYYTSTYERPPISDWFTCAACAEFIHERFLSRPADFATGCVHTLHVPCRVPINFFLIRGDVARVHFGAYARVSTLWDDEPYLSARVPERTGQPSVFVASTVVAHFSFGFQTMEAAVAANLLERYQRIAWDAPHRSQLDAEILRRTAAGPAGNLSRQCPGSAPAELQQGRRSFKPAHRARVEGGRVREVLFSGSARRSVGGSRSVSSDHQRAGRGGLGRARGLRGGRGGTGSGTRSGARGVGSRWVPLSLRAVSSGRARERRISAQQQEQQQQEQQQQEQQ